MVAIKVAKGDLNKKTVKFFRDVFLKAEDEVNKASGTVSTNVDSLPSSSSGAVVSVISSGTSMVSASSGSPAITYTVIYADLAVAGPPGSKTAVSILNERIQSLEYSWVDRGQDSEGYWLKELDCECFSFFVPFQPPHCPHDVCSASWQVPCNRQRAEQEEGEGVCGWGPSLGIRQGKIATLASASYLAISLA